MQIILKLYRNHDIDLLSFYKHPDINFSASVKQALRAYIEDKPIYFRQPKYNGNFSFSSQYQVRVNLDDVADKDIIDYITDPVNGLKPRMRNEFVKMVMRGCIIGPVAYNCFLSDSDGVTHDGSYDANSLKVIDPVPKGKKKYRTVPVIEKTYSIDSDIKNTESDKQPVVPMTPTVVPEAEYIKAEPEIKTAPIHEVKEKESAPIPPQPIERDPIPERMPEIKEEVREETVSFEDSSDEDDDDFDMFGSLDQMMSNF